MSEFGLEKKGGWAAEGDVPTAIDSGIPAGGSPGEGELAPWPVEGGTWAGNGSGPIG